MDNKYMSRALALAALGEGKVNPNPLVGAVIVKGDKIIGEGFHEYYGGPHAEVNAFRNATEDVAGAVMYVTLEPCSHYGKTPPCAEAIVKHKLSKVVIAMKDPNPLVAGRGIRLLEENGIEVVCGVLEEEAKGLNEIFLHYITENRPFVIMKTAMTLDGKIATATGHSKWITNEASRGYVHQIRHRVSGIMVGIGTVLKDDPSLTTRLPSGDGVDPVRIIVDSRGQIPLDARVLNLDSSARTIIATTDAIPKAKEEALIEKGAEVIVLPAKSGRVDLEKLMVALGDRQIDSVLVEGGGTLNWSALEAGQVDKVVSFIAPKIIGGSEAKTPVEGRGVDNVSEAIELRDVSLRMFGDDVMIEGCCKR